MTAMHQFVCKNDIQFFLGIIFYWQQDDRFYDTAYDWCCDRIGLFHYYILMNSKFLLPLVLYLYHIFFT